MAWPKGIARGPQSAEHKAARLAAVSAGLKRRWQNPTNRIRSIVGTTRSWQSGELAKRRIVWNDEMDSALRSLRASLSPKQFRMDAPRLLGVCDRAVMDRTRCLGLIDPERSLRSKVATKVWNTKSAQLVRETDLRRKEEIAKARQEIEDREQAAFEQAWKEQLR